MTTSPTHETSFIIRQFLLCVQVSDIGGHVASHRNTRFILTLWSLNFTTVVPISLTKGGKWVQHPTSCKVARYLKVSLFHWRIDWQHESKLRQYILTALHCATHHIIGPQITSLCHTSLCHTSYHCATHYTIVPHIIVPHIASLCHT
jgi:hypothetical protein